MMNSSGPSGDAWWGEGLIVLLMVLVLFAGVVWAMQVLRAVTRGAERTAPLDVLKRRYAAGEITFAEYEQVRHAIE